MFPFSYIIIFCIGLACKHMVNNYTSLYDESVSLISACLPNLILSKESWLFIRSYKIIIECCWFVMFHLINLDWDFFISRFIWIWIWLEGEGGGGGCVVGTKWKIENLNVQDFLWNMRYKCITVELQCTQVFMTVQ